VELGVRSERAKLAPVFAKHALSGKMRYSDYTKMLFPDGYEEGRGPAISGAAYSQRLSMDARNSLRRAFQTLIDCEERLEGMRTSIAKSDTVKSLFEELDTSRSRYGTERDIERIATGSKSLFSRYGRDSAHLSSKNFSVFLAPQSGSLRPN
jgi:hypothetical protein